jgi:hypothetical protein
MSSPIAAPPLFTRGSAEEAQHDAAYAAAASPKRTGRRTRLRVPPRPGRLTPKRGVQRLPQKSQVALP